MLGQSLILWVRQNKRGEVKKKEKDEPLFNYSFYRNWTLFNWFVEAFSLKTQRHKRHWVCCCIDLWWSDFIDPVCELSSCVMLSMCQIYCDSLFYVLITKQTHQRPGICLKDTLHIQPFILCWRKSMHFHSYLCKQWKTKDYLWSDGNYKETSNELVN